MSAYEIMMLTKLSQMSDVVTLQQTYWGKHTESVVPAHMLFTLAKTGGHVLAVYDSGRMIGVLIGLLSSNAKSDQQITMENLAFYSKRMVVLPEYRGQGIAENLKWRQFVLARQQGIGQIIWTYDPLLSRNAHLNLRKLGCVCEHYLVDYFGSDDSTGLAHGGSSDRFQVLWEVESPSVSARLEGEINAPSLDEYLTQGVMVVNPLQQQPPPEYNDTPRLLVEIPLDFPTLVAQNQALAHQWRSHVRSLFTTIHPEFRVIDFVRGVYDGRACGFYVVDIPK